VVARSWRIRGALDGTILSKDGGEDRGLYGMDVTNRAILHGQVPPSAVASVLTSMLERYPKKQS
jgi:lipid-binding SYLF domain-containing protein